MIVDTIVYVITDFTTTDKGYYTEVEWVYHRQSTGLVPIYAHEIKRAEKNGLTLLLTIHTGLEKEPNPVFLHRFFSGLMNNELGQK